jgi:hypothetical protein
MSSNRVIRFTTTSSYNPPVFLTDALTTSAGSNAGWSGSNVTLTNTRFNSYTRSQYFFSGNELTSQAGIPATRCWASITGTMSLSWSSTLPSGVIMDIPIEIATFGSGPYIVANTASGSYSRSLPTAQYITGDDVQTQPAGVPASINNFSTTPARRSFQSRRISGSGSYSFTVSSPNATFSGTITRRWEGTNHVINGLDGDTLAPLTVQSTVFTTVRTVYVGEATLSSRFSLQEQSQSVITGVEETLQNNFTLSATAKVEHRATVTLRQETELLGTTFNFRFMEPLSLIGNNTVSTAPAVIKNFSTSLILSSNAITDLRAGLIYDIAADYTWDDFSIIGYFVTGYTLRGYATDSAEYTWTDLASDPWDSYTYSSWQGLETGWDQWPEDLWNSTKRISFDFDFTEVGNIIASGVSQLLSTSALLDNSAFLKTGSSTLTLDFLCDGSPSGLIGGFTTITQDSILTGLGNYIINNAQNIEGAFDASLLANYIAKFLWSVRSDFSLAVAPTFKPGGVTNAQCITVVDALANAIYGPTKTLEGAFDPIFTARIFFTTDPYQIYRVLQETRQIFVDAESRGIQIAEEIRLNSIPAENRDYLVPQETRSMKLRIPPMTNRFTTPKVRTE